MMCLRRLWVRSIWEFMECGGWDGKKDGGPHRASHTGPLVLGVLLWGVKTSIGLMEDFTWGSHRWDGRTWHSGVSTQDKLHNVLFFNRIHRSSKNKMSTPPCARAAWSVFSRTNKKGVTSLAPRSFSKKRISETRMRCPDDVTLETGRGRGVGWDGVGRALRMTSSNTIHVYFK